MVTTPNTVVSLALTSLIFEIVLSLKTHLGFITTHGNSGQTNAKGQCLSSPAA